MRTIVASGAWTEERQRELAEGLGGFWADDVWEMSRCPLAPPKNAPAWRIHFNHRVARINSELKYACRQKFESGEWTLGHAGLGTSIRCLIKWLERKESDLPSLAVKGISEMQLSPRSYLLRSKQKKSKAPRNDPLTTLNQIYRVLAEWYSDLSEYERDVWDLRRLGINLASAQSTHSLNFTGIEQEWLRLAARQYLRVRLQVLAVESCASILRTLRVFSSFLLKYPELQPSGLNRQIIVEFLAFLTTKRLSVATRAVHLSFMRSFFDYCSREQLIEGFPDATLIYNDDFPARERHLPRHIPEDVMQKLNLHLEGLPTHWRRVILILQECGMRVSELLLIPFNCLERDHEGDWFLRYYQGKVRREHTQPVSKEVASVIQNQQRDVTEQWGENMPILFPNSKGHPYAARSLAAALDRLSGQHDIPDSSGRRWHFHPHQFRHTVGTRLVNNGLSTYEVQMILGHKSPTMTERYARVHHETLKRKHQEYLANRRLVDIAGKVCEETNPADQADLQILKKSLHSQTLPNGYCTYPVAQGPCPHSNACLTCRHFRTDRSFLPVLERQLSDTQGFIKKAEENGWERAAEMNRVVEANLVRIIPLLKLDNETQA